MGAGEEKRIETETRSVVCRGLWELWRGVTNDCSMGMETEMVVAQHCDWTALNVAESFPLRWLILCYGNKI